MAETEEKTYITPECQAAMIEHGVLMKDGKPAGMELMNKDVIRVAIASPEHFQRFQSLMLQSINLEDKLEYYDATIDFPDNIQELTSEAFAFWYSGKVEFVEFDDKPDLRIFAFDKEGAFGSFPVNTDLPSIGASEAIIGIGLQSYPTDQSIMGVIRHEIGHALFGVDHPHDAIRLSSESWADSRFGGQKVREEFAAKCNDLSQEAVTNWEGVMSYGPDGENDYDRGARDFVRTGIAPKPDGGMKP